MAEANMVMVEEVITKLGIIAKPKFDLAYY